MDTGAGKINKGILRTSKTKEKKSKKDTWDIRNYGTLSKMDTETKKTNKRPFRTSKTKVKSKKGHLGD